VKILWAGDLLPLHPVFLESAGVIWNALRSDPQDPLKRQSLERSQFVGRSELCLHQIIKVAGILSRKTRSAVEKSLHGRGGILQLNGQVVIQPL
jgi:hypothetical protein